MRWYVPSWNGDVRFESVDDKTTKLSIIAPTKGEIVTLAELHKDLRKKKWLDTAHADTLWPADMAADGTHDVSIAAPLSKVGPLVLKRLKPGVQTLTAIVLKNETIEIVEGTDENKLAAAAELAEKQGSRAATVKRPTPCCPQCMSGAVAPANEVLQAFLSPAQHEAWARYRAFEVRGGTTGFRYLLAHRHSATAQRMGRIAYDLDHRRIMHFHDWSVPPEEEVLAAKLVLEHREPWLRNEATLLGGGDDGELLRFKNPFGDHTDGVADSIFTSALGGVFWSACRDLRDLLPELDKVIAAA